MDILPKWIAIVSCQKVYPEPFLDFFGPFTDYLQKQFMPKNSLQRVLLREEYNQEAAFLQICHKLALLARQSKGHVTVDVLGINYCSK